MRLFTLRDGPPIARFSVNKCGQNSNQEIVSENRHFCGHTGGSPLDAADRADYPVILLQSPDTEDAPSGYVEVPGSNVLFTDTPPGVTSGGAVNGQRTITVRPLVTGSLPPAATTTLPNGTLLDLVDSYGNPQGMYRLDALAKVWRRRDVGASLRLQKDTFVLAGNRGPFALSQTPSGAFGMLFEDLGLAADTDYTVAGNQLTLAAGVDITQITAITFVYSY